MDIVYYSSKKNIRSAN